MHANNSRQILVKILETASALRWAKVSSTVLGRWFGIAEIHWAHRNRLNELQLYQTTFVDFAFSRLNAVAFSSLNI